MRKRTALLVAGAAVAGAVAYRRIVRPWMTTLGATATELEQPLS